MRTIIEYTLAAFVVLVLGALSGWYFFLHSQSQATTAYDAARGLGSPSTAPQTNTPPAQPSAFSRMLSAITGEGTGVSPSPSSSALPSNESSPFASSSVPTPQAEKRPPQLWHVHTKPVAGIAFVKSGNVERLRFVERATGYVYEADAKTSIVTRITNTLTPKIYEAILTSRGRIIKRSLDEQGRITTSISASIGVVGTSSNSVVGATTSTLTLSSVTLTQGIAQIVADPRSDAIFYLVNTASGVEGFRSEWNGAKPKRVFTSVLTRWQPTWLSDGRIILTQAAADSVPGYAYELTESGALRSLVRGVAGLTILPSDSGALLFGESNGGQLAIFARANQDAPSIRLPIKTIADKCVWSPAGTPDPQGTSTRPSTKNVAGGNLAYCAVPQALVTRNFLDQWYQGAIHSSDTLWRIDASNASAELAYRPDMSTTVDILNPTIDSTGEYLAFMNASDQSLWVLRIRE